MKKFLFLTLALATLATQAFADTTIKVSKAGASTAKVCEFDNDKCLGTVPITFASGASWDSLKDSYTITDATAAAISSKKVSFSVADTGTITFKTAPKSSTCSKQCTKAKAKSKK